MSQLAISCGLLHREYPSTQFLPLAFDTFPNNLGFLLLFLVFSENVRFFKHFFFNLAPKIKFEMQVSWYSQLYNEYL